MYRACFSEASIVYRLRCSPVNLIAISRSLSKKLPCPSMLYRVAPLALHRWHVGTRGDPKISHIPRTDAHEQHTCENIVSMHIDASLGHRLSVRLASRRTTLLYLGVTVFVFRSPRTRILMHMRASQFLNDFEIDIDILYIAKFVQYRQAHIYGSFVLFAN